MGSNDSTSSVPVTGVKEGLKDVKGISRNVGPLIDVQQLKRDYLFGINVMDQEGNPLSDESYRVFLDNAISTLEHQLDINITPTNVTESKDYRLNDYSDWGFMYLNEYPVIKLISLEMVYFENAANQPETIQTIPTEWIRLQDMDGIIRLIPNARFPANLQVDNSGNFFPEVLRSNMVPNLWRINYISGFSDGKVPNIINQAIGMMAAIQAMNLGGIQVFGPGVASKSIGLDGMSQSISTTVNAENGAYSPVIHAYQNLLYGTKENDHNGLISILRDYYKGESVGVL